MGHLPALLPLTQFLEVCEVGIIDHSPALLHLFRMHWGGIHWVDPLDKQNSEQESEHELSSLTFGRITKSTGPDVDDVYGMW